MTTLPPGHRAFYWERHTDGSGSWRNKHPKPEVPPGGDLAALRRGIGRQPGEVPQMWPFYTTLNPDGQLTPRLLAEHAALTLFAVHQQSRADPVHRADIGVGAAMLTLRHSEKFSTDAVDRRFSAAATATSLAEVTTHLRGLITQLRGTDQGLDYTRLCWDLRDWQDPARLPAVRRRWGGQYFARTAPEPEPAAEPATR